MQSGRVISVNVSPGGLPKLPIERAWVGTLGVEGDAHNEPTVHGGPHRAVCLFGVEAIARVQAEGHPLGPGSVGENLTTEGIDWSDLPVGTRVRVGDTLLMELASPAMPCDTQRPNFNAGRINRISIKLFPSDSRMYARVLVEGEVKPGDRIELLAPAEDSNALTHRLLDRLDEAEQEANLRLWRAGRAAGHDVRILDDGDLSAAASPDLPGTMFNNCTGLRGLPQFLPMVLDHYRAAGVTGWLPTETPPWPDAAPDFTLAIMVTDPIEVPTASVDGVTIRALRPDEWAEWADICVRALALDAVGARPWLDPAEHLLASRGVHVVIAEEGGVAVGVGSLHVHKRAALLRSGMVVPQARDRGVQRALIAARARLAAQLGCDVITSQAPLDGFSERNLAAMGFARVWERPGYRFDP